jgi:hypothetical protein
VLAVARWAWAGCAAEMARVATAANVTNVFLMASPYDHQRADRVRAVNPCNYAIGGSLT